MLCDKYKEALIEAAASGAALPGGLREHVEVCAICGARLAAERTLFAAIDGGLHKAANAKVRSSFLPNVKANLATKTIPARNPIPGRALVCATAALALAVAFLSVLRGDHDKARTGAITVPSKVPAGAGGVELSLAPEHKTRYSATVLRAAEQENAPHIASPEPEVLIQPEEEEFLKRFYAAMRNPERYARAEVTDDPEVTAKPLIIEQIEVRDLKIENLDEESGLAQTGTK
jgi:hypothetical protein